MKKLLAILIALLIPVSAFAKNPFSFLKPKGKNYTSFCSTTPKSSPVSITLSEIGYNNEKTTIGEGFSKNEIKNNPAEIYIRHSLKNNGNKTITACYFSVQIYFTTFAILDHLLYEGNAVWEGIRIKPGKSYAETHKETFISSNKYHDYIKSGLYNHITKVDYKVYLVKYSDGTSESMTP